MDLVVDQLVQCVDFDSFMLPMISQVTADNRITQFFYAFNSTGLFYSSPARSYPQLFNQALTFDPLNRDWFLDVKRHATAQFLALVTSPYRQLDSNTIGQDVCFGVWTNSDLDLVLCLSVSQTILDASLQDISVSSKSYGFVLNSDTSVFSYPGYNRSSLAIPDIFDLEFGSNSSSDAVAFNASVMHYFQDGNRALAKYTKDGEKWLIAISPAEIDMGTNGLYRRDLSAAIVMPESVLWARVNTLKSESNTILIIESVIVFAILAAMVVVGWL